MVVYTGRGWRGACTEPPRGVAEIKWEGQRIAVPLEVRKINAEVDGGKLRIWAVVGGVGASGQ